ncbi:MAG: sensor histidine kinase [Anaerolineae bacterium]
MDTLHAGSALLRSSAVDPDVRRRAETLNILLAAVFTISMLSVFYALTLGAGTQDTQLVLVASAALAGVSVGLYWLNRKLPVMASSLFLTLLTVLLALSDDPLEVVEGRASLFLALPVALSSMVLPPWTSFMTAALVILVTVVVGATVPGFTWAPFMAFGYLVFALAGFLGARQLESALAGLREINRTLDSRVMERTQALRQANDELSAANERLLELDRLKSRFVSMVSHELRTPLAAIQGFCEVLMAGIYGEMNERQENAIQRIVINSRQLLALVNDLLDQARIEAGQLQLASEPFSPEQVLKHVVDTQAVLAQDGVELRLSLTDLPDTLVGDRDRLRQVVINLVANALKFTPTGYVAVRARTCNAGTWEIAIEDTGPGIPEDAMETIFEPFKQADSSATRHHGGAGLGLAISNEIVGLMGGYVDVHSNEGTGSRFTVRLPIQLPEGQSGWDERV